MVRPPARLVAHRPHDHAGVVAVADHHTRHALHKGNDPFGTVAQAAAGMVRLDIGFVDYIETVLVAEIVEIGIVGIMRRAHGVESEPFHQCRILPHLLARDGLARRVAMVVAIDADQLHRHAVDQHAPALDTYVPEPDAAAPGLDHPAVFVGEGEYERIEVRGFRSPFVRRRNPGLQQRIPDVVALGIRFVEQFADGHFERIAGIDPPVCDIEQLRAQHIIPAARGIGARQRHRRTQLELRIAILRIEHRPHAVIGDRGPRFGGQIDLAVDSAQPPMVRILQITSVAPFQHLDGQPVLALPQQFRNIEFGGQRAVLGIAGETAVHPYTAGRVDAAEVQYNPVAVPRTGHFESPDITSGGIIAPDKGRRVGIGINNIGVNRITVSGRLPAGGHFDTVPCGDIVFRSFEALRRTGNVVGEAEAPDAVERKEARTAAVGRKCIFGRRIGVRGRARIEPAAGIDKLVFPVGIPGGQTAAQTAAKNQDQVPSHIQVGFLPQN